MIKQIYITIFYFVIVSSLSFSHMSIQHPNCRVLGIQRQTIASNMPFGERGMITNVKLIVKDIVREGGNEEDILYINFVGDVHPLLMDGLYDAEITQDEEDLEGNIEEYHIVDIGDDITEFGFNVKQYTNSGEKEDLIIDFMTINDPNDPIIDYAIEQTEAYYFKHWQDEEGNILSNEPNYQFNITRDITLTAVFDKTSQKKDGWYHTYLNTIQDFIPQSSALLNFVLHAKYNDKSGFVFIPSGEGTFYARRFILEITIESMDTIRDPSTLKIFTNRPPVLSF